MPKLDPTAAIEWMQKREAARVKYEEWKFATLCAEDMGDEPLPRPASFTNDKIIHDWRFCNVRREDDRVTAWIRDHIRKPFADHPALWLMLMIARQLNYVPTLEALIAPGRFHAWPSDEDFTPHALAHALDELTKVRGKIYTGAYIISAPPTKGALKTHYTAFEVIGKPWGARGRFEAYFDRKTDFKSLRDFHDILSGYKGWGPFLAYQAIVDMRFTSLLRDANDVQTWCAAGPGTIRGLRRLMGESKPKPEMRQDVARQLIRELEPHLRETGIAFDFSDIPNILCETDKFLRVRNGEGTPRAKFVPGRGH